MSTESDTIDVSTLFYAESDSASDMSNKVHGVVEAMEAEGQRWHAYRLHLFTCPVVTGNRIVGRCQTCDAARAELGAAPEQSARYMDLDDAWRSLYAHNHKTLIINWQNYADLLFRLVETIYQTRVQCRALLVHDADLCQRTIETLSDVVSELAGTALDETARRDALCQDGYDAYAAWTEHRNAVIWMLVDDQTFKTGIGDAGSPPRIMLQMHLVRLRALETQRPTIDNLFKHIIQKMDEERRAAHETGN